MILENLNSLFENLDFLEPHHAGQRRISFETQGYTSCITVRCDLDIIPSNRRPRGITSNDYDTATEYDIYPLIKEILNYFHIDIRKFYNFKQNVNPTKFEISIFLLNDGWIFGYDIGNELDDIDIPEPLSDKDIERIKEETRKFAEKFNNRYNTASYSYSFSPT